MTTKFILSVMIATLIFASGAAGSSFYIARAQEQAAVLEAEITLDDQALSGSEIDIQGSNFESNSEVSIYFMSAVQANLTNSSAFIMQEISSNESTNATEPEEGNNLFDDALNGLEDLFGLNDDEGDTASSANQGSLLIALEDLTNGTISLECDDEEIVEGDLDGTNLVSLAAQPGIYNECSISISDGNIVDAGQVGSLTIIADPNEGYESSIVSSTIADDQGSFTESITLPEVVEGQYAVLAASTEGIAAVSPLTVIPDLPAETLDLNASETMNETSTLLEANATVTQNQTEEVEEKEEDDDNNNQTTVEVDNQTAIADANIQLDEESAEPGEPLPVSGEGFAPNTPVQIFINNIQITNVVTNIEGSFNTVVIVPTTVGAGDAEVTVKTEQTNIVKNVVIVEQDGQNKGPATVRFTSVSATDNAQTLRGAPVTIFDTGSGDLVESSKTPIALELEAGTYSVFYSDFSNYDFQSAEPGRWTDTPDGGSGLITVREGRNATVTAMYSEQPAPPPPQRDTENSLTLRAEDTDGNPISGMFVTVYDADTGEKIEQGFTVLTAEDLSPGTYPVFFANFANLEFVSASPGSWLQTPFGGAGLLTIPDDGEDHDITVTAVYERTTDVAQEQFDIQAPLNIRGSIFSITSNETRPEGPFVMSGSFALRVDDEDPVRASFSAYLVSVREDSNENVDLESQESRDHDTFQIVDFEPRVARPVGIDAYLVSGTADLLLDGDMYSNDERIEVMVRGGEELTPTNVEIEFQGDHRYSADNRLETLFGVVTSGFQ